MRVILIDPWNQMVVITTKQDGHEDYYRLLSGASPDGLRHTRVTCFAMTMLSRPTNHLLVVDDEGYLKEEQAFFTLDGRTFAGRAVLVGDSGDEDEGPATASVDDVLVLISWIPPGSTVSISRPVIRSFDTTEELLRYLGGSLTMAHPPRPSPSQTPAISALPPALARLATLLRDGNGAFVAGTALSRGVGIPLDSLPRFIADLRRRQPDLVIEGRRGHGYRLVAPAVAATAALADTEHAPFTPAHLPRTDPLDQFQAPLAEIVRGIALASGETVEATIARLVAYGAEVHRELVMAGENLLGLCRPGSERQPRRRTTACEDRRLGKASPCRAPAHTQRPA